MKWKKTGLIRGQNLTYICNGPIIICTHKVKRPIRKIDYDYRLYAGHELIKKKKKKTDRSGKR